MPMPDRQRWRRLAPLLDELMDLAPPERAARLAALRAGDPATADELDAILAASVAANAMDFLGGEAPAAAPESPTLAGTRIGAYVIDAPLGQGGSGSVWRAHRDDGRYEGQVAIKLLHFSLIGRAAAQRFSQEGALLARLSHPNIARLLDAGVSANGQPYLVLELVEGERIDVWCERRALGVEQRLALFDEVLAAVAHAHSHLIIHRDIKPNNILVDADGHVKLLDFGISRLVEDESREATVTVLGQRAMTPEFAAPEQVAGEMITTATDVYALGVLLYLLLGGRQPTEREGAARAEAARAALDTEPLPLAASMRAAGGPSAAALAAARGTSQARLRRQLGGDLEKIVAHALRKRPDERYQTVAALADDLRRHREHEPVLAREDGVLYRCGKFVRRHRAGVATAAALLVAIGAGVTGTLTQAARAQAQATAARAQAARADAQARIAESERASALRELTRSEASDAFMRFVLSQSPSRPVTMPQMLANAETAIARQFAGEPGLQAYLRLVVADLYGEIELYDRAAPLLEQARTGAQHAGDVALAAQADCTLAGLESATGRGDGASRRIDEDIRRLEQIPQAEHDGLVDCLNERAIRHRDAGEAKETLADAEAAIAHLGTPRPGQRVTQVVLMEAMADARMVLGQTAAAITGYEATLARLDEIGRSGTSMALSESSNLGTLLSRAGQWRRADAVFRKARANAPSDLPVMRQVLDTNHARLLLSLGRGDEAQPMAEAAFAVARQGGNRRAQAYTAMTAAAIACDRGQLERCSARLDYSAAAFAKLQPVDASGLGTLGFMRADLALRRHDLAAAQAGLRQTIAGLSAMSEWSPMLARSQTLLSRADLQAGDVAAALRDAGLAVASTRRFGEGLAANGWLGEALLARAKAERAQGDRIAAAASLHEALAILQQAGGDDAPSTREARALVAQFG